jgi:DNA-binding MarR family transcriptional regulator
MTATGQPAATSSSRTSARRQELADELFASMKAFKRRLDHAAPCQALEDVEGVTSYQLEALVWLMSSPGGIPMNDLARAQGVGLSSGTALADRLVRHGLAVRSSDPADRRVVRLAATDRAKSIVERFQAERRTQLMELLAALDDQELATLIGLMQTMAQAPQPQEQS